MIIGLMGPKGSGKDTVGAYLVKQHKFERRAFADAGKKYLASVLDIPYHEIERFKNDESCFVTTGNKNEPTHLQDMHPSADDLHVHMWSPIREQSFRDFLRNFIENAKEVFGDDVWTNIALPVRGFY